MSKETIVYEIKLQPAVKDHTIQISQGNITVKNVFGFICFLTALVGCTHANVSSVPEIVQGKTVFTYQGRSNFGHQLKVADREMAKQCASFNGGTPVLISRVKEDLGYVVSGNSASSNQNQIVRFSCER
jgi:hypothetical protein